MCVCECLYIMKYAYFHCSGVINYMFQRISEMYGVHFAYIAYIVRVCVYLYLYSHGSYKLHVSEDQRNVRRTFRLHRVHCTRVCVLFVRVCVRASSMEIPLTQYNDCYRFYQILSIYRIIT